MSNFFWLDGPHPRAASPATLLTFPARTTPGSPSMRISAGSPGSTLMRSASSTLPLISS
jgi:hypothetical protein